MSNLCWALREGLPVVVCLLQVCLKAWFSEMSRAEQHTGYVIYNAPVQILHGVFPALKIT